MCHTRVSGSSRLGDITKDTETDDLGAMHHMVSCAAWTMPWSEEVV